MLYFLFGFVSCLFVICLFLVYKVQALSKSLDSVSWDLLHVKIDIEGLFDAVEDLSGYSAFNECGDK